jgi:hypothetical protein
VVIDKNDHRLLQCTTVQRQQQHSKKGGKHSNLRLVMKKQEIGQNKIK